MELAKQEVGALKFYQKISFWVVFFISIFILASLFGEIIIYPHYFQYNYRFYFLRSWWADFFNWLPHFFAILPVGIYLVLNYFWQEKGVIIPNIIFNLTSLVIWTLSLGSIIFFRKKAIFKILAIIIISWFVLNAFGLGWGISLQLNGGK